MLLTNRTLSKQGFTLLEMMITIIIMAILASIALPSYQRYVTKSRLEEGKSVLNQNYLWLDKMYNKNNGYYVKNSSGVNSPIQTANLPFARTGDGDKGYVFSITSECTRGATADATANTFCLQATPQSGQAGASGGGKECGTIMVDQSGQYYIQPKKNGPISDSTSNDGVTCF